MKKIHETKYILYKNNIKKDINIIVISDLHYSDKIKDNKLNMILNHTKNSNPDYILFPGDIINSLEEIDNESKLKRLTSWLEKLSLIAPLIMSYGNHEYYKKDLNKKISIGDTTTLFKEINKLNNVYFLDNDKYEDDNIEVIGFTENPLSIHPLEHFTMFKSIKENKLDKINELTKLNNKYNKLNDNKIKILLSHSPVYYKDKELIDLTKKYDYIISGHMHNGCVPPIIYELWNSSRGFISPTKSLFSDLERNTLKNNNDKLIVNGALTTFHTKKIILKLLNSMFPYYMTKIVITNNILYDKDIVYKETKYYKKNC